METAVVRNLGKTGVMIARGKRNVAVIQQNLHLCGIRFTPVLVVCGSLPGQFAYDLHTVGQFVETETGKIRVIV